MLKGISKNLMRVKRRQGQKEQVWRSRDIFRDALKYLLCLSLLLPCWAQADIYKWTDAQGNVHFSDKPTAPHAKKHQTQRINSIGNPTFNLENMSMQIPYKNEHGSMIVHGVVNGISMRFIVDTGATLVVIPPIIAKQARIVTKGAKYIRLQTANGITTAPQVSLTQLHIGKFNRRNVSAVIQKISPDGITGLLGMSFLKAYRMTVDQQKKLIVLEKK